MRMGKAGNSTLVMIAEVGAGSGQSIKRLPNGPSRNQPEARVPSPN